MIRIGKGGPSPQGEDILSPQRERGNALIYVLIAIALLAALTLSLSQNHQTDTQFVDNAESDEQIARLLGYAGTAANAINQMVVGGIKPETMYTTLDLVRPTDAAYNTPPHSAKLYHPLGGGLEPQDATSFSTSNSRLAYSFKINKGAIVQDIGPTQATVGDILFTARISTLTQCRRINSLLRGNATVPVLTSASFTSLFDTGSAVSLTSANCAGCVGVAQQCVSNTGASQFGYYAALFPG